MSVASKRPAFVYLNINNIVLIRKNINFLLKNFNKLILFTKHMMNLNYKEIFSISVKRNKRESSKTFSNLFSFSVYLIKLESAAILSLYIHKNF